MSSSSTSGRWAAREPARGTPAPAQPQLARLRGLDGLDVVEALAAGDALSVRPGSESSRLRDQGLGVPCTSARHRVLGREDSVGAYPPHRAVAAD